MDNCENIMLIAIGVVFVILALINISGNISTIHWYNRIKVSKNDEKKYGRAIGIGVLIMGVSFILGAVIALVFRAEVQAVFATVGCAAGTLLILYGQFKYNKGIF